MQSKSLKILGTSTRSDLPRYAWQTVTDPDEIAAIERKSRQQFLKRFILQALLQCFTFTGAIVTYHYVALPGLLKDSYQNGQAAGWSNAVEQTCPEIKGRIGG
jgi:hypothetical protein